MKVEKIKWKLRNIRKIKKEIEEIERKGNRRETFLVSLMCIAPNGTVADMSGSNAVVLLMPLSGRKNPSILLP